MWDFDILFLDTSSKKYYDYHVLEKEALGGTEATVVRIAEALAGFGLRVAVVHSQIPYFEPMTSKHAFYFHSDDLAKITCKHYVQIRGVKNSHLYPKAKKYVWLHDAADERLKEWNPIIGENKITVVGVSKFHRKEIKRFLFTHDVEYIYNPVQDEIYKPKDVELKYDPNTLVWAASPHKGLGKGLEIFKKIKQRLPDANLVIANPGYHNVDHVQLSAVPGVQVMGPQSCKTLWAVLQNSMCLYYPSQFDETFGLILAEANALGVPMLGYQHGVLNETVSSDDQLVEDGNEDLVLDRAVEWTKTRPKVSGRDEFRLSRVIFRWINLFAGVR